MLIALFLLGCVGAVVLGQRAYYSDDETRFQRDIARLKEFGVDRVLFLLIAFSITALFALRALAVLLGWPVDFTANLALTVVLLCTGTTIALCWRALEFRRLTDRFPELARTMFGLLLLLISILGAADADRRIEALARVSSEEFSTARTALTLVYAALYWILALCAGLLVAMAWVALKFFAGLWRRSPADSTQAHAGGSQGTLQLVLFLGLAYSAVGLPAATLNLARRFHDPWTQSLFVHTGFSADRAVRRICRLAPEARFKFLGDGEKMAVFDHRGFSVIPCPRLPSAESMAAGSASR